MQCHAQPPIIEKKGVFGRDRHADPGLYNQPGRESPVYVTGPKATTK
jgi:hypothetical protein